MENSYVVVLYGLCSESRRPGTNAEGSRQVRSSQQYTPIEHHQHNYFPSINLWRNIVNRIKAKPEGREGMYIVQKEDMIDWLLEYPEELIHNYKTSTTFAMGANWSKEGVIDQIKLSERVAVMTGKALINNLRHALAVITDNKLDIFDIGEITDEDILLTN